MNYTFVWKERVWWHVYILKLGDIILESNHGPLIDGSSSTCQDPPIGPSWSVQTQNSEGPSSTTHTMALHAKQLHATEERSHVLQPGGILIWTGAFHCVLLLIIMHEMVLFNARTEFTWYGSAAVERHPHWNQHCRRWKTWTIHIMWQPWGTSMLHYEQTHGGRWGQSLISIT